MLNLQKVWAPMIYPLPPNEYWNYDIPRALVDYGTLVPDENCKSIVKKHGQRGRSVRIHTQMDQSRSVKVKRCSRCHE